MKKSNTSNKPVNKKKSVDKKCIDNVINTNVLNPHFQTLFNLTFKQTIENQNTVNLVTDKKMFIDFNIESINKIVAANTVDNKLYYYNELTFVNCTYDKKPIVFKMHFCIIKPDNTKNELLKNKFLTSFLKKSENFEPAFNHLFIAIINSKPVELEKNEKPFTFILATNYDQLSKSQIKLLNYICKYNLFTHKQNVKSVTKKIPQNLTK